MHLNNNTMHGSPGSEVATAGSLNDINNANIKDPPSNEVDVTGKQKLRSWLNKNLKIEMTDGRVLVGVFLCTDRDGNVILGSCSEYLKPEDCGSMEEPRVLGLVMVPGRHVVSIHLDDMPSYNTDIM